VGVVAGSWRMCRKEINRNCMYEVITDEYDSGDAYSKAQIREVLRCITVNAEIKSTAIRWIGGKATDKIQTT